MEDELAAIAARLRVLEVGFALFAATVHPALARQWVDDLAADAVAPDPGPRVGFVGGRFTIGDRGRSLQARSAARLGRLLRRALSRVSPAPGPVAAVRDQVAWIEERLARLESTVRWLETKPPQERRRDQLIQTVHELANRIDSLEATVASLEDPPGARGHEDDGSR